ncbi:MAG: 2-succinyl-5-enolpyruvyl-6-hydroxy-3-cyclohexene-1-carboxylate synthase, partial [Alphaproteobacteria bacterium]|nr:2-succinyl-5-enolpyruvyl-6-hydroxy-3-cyclohexene-1-carboxylate synthase [Alphaproteobacteria bacterium]
QNDIKALYVELPKITDMSDKNKCLDYLNAALATAKYKNKPVHINCPAYLNMDSLLNTLPNDTWAIEYYESNFEKQKEFLNSRNTMIFIGSHSKFSNNETQSIEKFALSWDIPVICDHTSNYHGKNKILTSQLANLVTDCPKPDLVIDIGRVCGEYASAKTFGNTIWRVSKDENFAFRFSKPVEKYFNCSEKYFFDSMINNSKTNNAYFSTVNSKINTIVFPEAELSTIHIAKKLCKHIPANSSLHLAILNSLRSVNFFNLEETIDVNCNVGGFGIDGALSTAVGQSLAAKGKKVFCLIGDLAFFYDMNILGNNNIKNNLRIIVINNQRGEEFRLNPVLENNLGDKIDKLIAAAGHNKNGVKGWVTSCGFHYMSASTIEEFNNKIESFCNDEFTSSVIFEIFTQNENEQNALNLYRQNNRSVKKKKNFFPNLKEFLKRNKQ